MLMVWFHPVLSVMFFEALDDEKQQEEEKKEEESTDQPPSAGSQEVQVTQLTLFCTICHFFFFLSNFINICLLEPSELFVCWIYRRVRRKVRRRKVKIQRVRPTRRLRSWKTLKLQEAARPWRQPTHVTFSLLFTFFMRKSSHNCKRVSKSNIFNSQVSQRWNERGQKKRRNLSRWDGRVRS